MVFKCKMCGGSLEITDSSKSTVECEFCGSLQTLPRLDNEKKNNLYNRANNLRLRNEFDKALVVYEQILSDYPDEAEAHWGLCLCKYGIEYVDDPKTAMKIPTCHRTLYESILDDQDYLEALKNADVVARDVYKSEAAEINRIQKEIISIAQKEEPYDIFICYKETDENNNRTQDSVLAQDIYDRLTEKGYKVFFARITLEDKLGLEYEPIIFAALRSSRIMLAVGTKEEYFNAVWVRNEWSRYLSFMSKDKNKYLIPCYKDIDPYDMPQEFSNLQSQDMSKLGYIQDLTRGIEKIIGVKKAVSKHNDEIAPQSNGSSRLKRVLHYMDSDDWANAEVVIERLLDDDFENPEYYFYSALIKLRMHSKEEIIKARVDLSQNKEFCEAKKYAKGDYLAFLNSIESKIKSDIEYENNEKAYMTALKLYNAKAYVKSLDILKNISNFPDASDLLKKCQSLLDEKYDEGKRLAGEHKYSEALNILIFIADYKDVKSIVTDIRYGEYYESGIKLYEEEKYKEAISKFSASYSYKDSKEYIAKCNEKLALIAKEDIYQQCLFPIGYDIKEELGKVMSARNQLEKISDYKDAKQLIDKYNQDINARLAELRSNNKPAKKAVIATILIVAIAITIAIIVLSTVLHK